MSRKNLELMRMQEFKTRNTCNKNNQTSDQLNYHEPIVYSLGSVEKIESYYNGSYYDGPNSSYYYEG